MPGLITRFIDSRALKLSFLLVLFAVYYHVQLWKLERKHPRDHKPTPAPTAAKTGNPEVDLENEPEIVVSELGEFQTWTRAWLRFATVESYAVCAVLGLIAAYTESRRSRLAAVGWLLGCVLLGAPCCCIYAAYRLWVHGTLGLVDNAAADDAAGASPGTPLRERKPSK